MRLSSVMLYVQNLELMKQFYGDMLGVKPTNQNGKDTWATFETGSARFTLHVIAAEVAKQIEVTSVPFGREMNPVKLIFEVKDVESERARLESIGIKIIRRPWQQPGEACDAVDPEGNVFQICSGADSPL